MAMDTSQPIHADYRRVVVLPFHDLLNNLRPLRPSTWGLMTSSEVCRVTFWIKAG